MKAIAYLRVSTEEQARSGLGLEAQEAAIRSHCAAQGWGLVDICRDEGVSGASLQREVLWDAIRRTEEYADCLVVLKLDRLTRSLSDLCGLLRRFEGSGKGLVAVQDALDTQSASGKLLTHIMGAFAEFERNVISERTKDALAAKRARGETLGRPAAPVNPSTLLAIQVLREDRVPYAVIGKTMGMHPEQVRRIAVRHNIG